MTASNDIRLGQLGQIAMPARDIDRAVEFYRDQLGVPFLFRVPNLAFFDCGGVRLMISAPEGTPIDKHGSVLYFTVDGIHAAYTALAGRGVPFDDEPHIVANMDTYDLWMAFFRDPDGNVLGIMSEAPRQ